MNKIRKTSTPGKLSLGFRSAFFAMLVICPIIQRCVYPFDPVIKQGQEMLVIEGSIIKGEKSQTIYISQSTDYNEPQFLPVSGCLVRVVDDQNILFSFTEKEKGVYVSEIPDEKLAFGRSYQLLVTTPDFRNYESTQEILLQSAPIDSLYFAEETAQTTTDEDLTGIRFYTDLKATGTESRFYRWVMEETWEYHRKFPIEVRWNGDRRMREKLPGNPDSLIICWITNPVGGFYNSSTINLQINEKKKIPLNFVSNLTPRLEIKYSLLVRQYPLNEKIYRYFDTKKSEIQESGGLYQIQPLQSIGNITNVDDPAEKVLGCFWASSFSQKRIFVEPPHQFPQMTYCRPLSIDWQSIMRSKSGPSFYITMVDGAEYTADDMCFDCTKTGGKLKKPAFW